MILSWFGIRSERIIRLWEILRPYLAGFLLIMIGMLIVIDVIMGTFEFQYLKQTHKSIIVLNNKDFGALVSPARAYAPNRTGNKKVAVGKETGSARTTSPDTQSIENRIKEVFGSNPKVALAIAHSESGFDPGCPSNTDITKDGFVYSWGLMQINLTAHEVAGLPCPTAFKGHNNQAVVVNRKLYDQCVKAAKNIENNLAVAHKIFIVNNLAQKRRPGDVRGFSSWGAYQNGAYTRFL